VAAFVAGLALLFGPPSPVVHSQGDQVTAGRGSYCWAGDSGANGLQPYACADATPPVSDRPLSVDGLGTVLVDMRTDTVSLGASLRGRGGELPVVAEAGSTQRFVVRLPRRVAQSAVLDLHAGYPRGEASFGVRLMTPPRAAPPKPVLTAAEHRLVMARGSYCWSRPPVGLCVDTAPPTTGAALNVRRDGEVRVDTRLAADLVAASIRHGPGNLGVAQVDESQRRFVILLPHRLKRNVVLDLFARYPQGDGSFGARLRVR
jgi:hypothetical protein